MYVRTNGTMDAFISKFSGRLHLQDPTLASARDKWKRISPYYKEAIDQINELTATDTTPPGVE